MANYLIIGASSGIGKALSGILKGQGHSVFGTYKDNTLDEPQTRQFEVGNTLETDWLPEQLDGFVYCPGSINLKPFTRISPDAFTKDFALQVGGAVHCLQSALPMLKKSNNASVVFFSTVAVQSGFNFHTQVSASKGAIEGLTKALAAEYAPKIRFNAIAPSLTDTPLAGKMLSSPEKKQANGERHPMQRVGEPEDIAEMAAFLLSEKTSWISGQIISVDGGMSTLKR